MPVQFDNIGEVKPKVTVGGQDKTKFVPNLNVSFHDDEFYFNLNRKDKIIKNEKAATASGKTSLGGIDTDIWYIDDKGRFKWDIEFTSRPAANSWTWELKHTKGIEFYYQGELTAEEIADGCVRPDEVVGSYAVYCNKAHNKYKTGKLCHIYRPFCYDAKGNTIYADLKIADGQLTITIDAGWLDNAAYPVRLDPTFGYATQGGTSFNGVASQIQGTRYAPVSAGTAESISLYVANGSSGNYWKTALYTYSSSSQSFVAESAESDAIVTGWSTLALSTTPDITAIEYVICHRASNGGVVLYYDSDGASSNQYGYGDLSYSSAWPASVSMDFHISVRFSIYCTYSTTGGTGNSYYYQQQQM